MTTRIHLMPERDRAMAETYTQNVDGSSNPTGAAEPQKAPVITRAVSREKAENKQVKADAVENKTAKSKKD